MLRSSVTEEQETADRRPMFAPVLLKGAAPRKGGFSYSSEYSRTAQALRQTTCHSPQALLQHEQEEPSSPSADHPMSGRR